MIGTSQSKGDNIGFFKHAQSLKTDDVWRLQVVEGMNVSVEIAAEG